jgi:CheY-like chemotaxis protein
VPEQPVELFLIEDNPADVALIWHVLAESGMKVKVHTAMDGQQALQMLVDPHFEPSLIVLDLNIPKIPGLIFAGAMGYQNSRRDFQLLDRRTRETTCSGIGSKRVCFEILGSLRVQ